MNELVIGYKDYEIRFDEGNETWSCLSLDIDQRPTLKAVKAEIDRLSHKDRTLNLKALHISSGSLRDKPQIVEVTVSIMCGEERDYRSGGDARAVLNCWAKNARGERSKYRIDQIYPLASLPDLEHWLVLDRAARAARKEAEEWLKGIPAYNADMLAREAKETKAGS